MNYFKFIFACVVATSLATSCISTKNAKTRTPELGCGHRRSLCRGLFTGSHRRRIGKRKRTSRHCRCQTDCGIGRPKAAINSQRTKTIRPWTTLSSFCELSQEYWQKGELENALEALDQAYDHILKVDDYDNPVLLQQKDDLRFTISKRTSGNIRIQKYRRKRQLQRNPFDHQQPRAKRDRSIHDGRGKTFFHRILPTLRTIPPHDRESSPGGRPSPGTVVAPSHRKRLQGQRPVQSARSGSLAVHSRPPAINSASKGTATSTKGSISKNRTMAAIAYMKELHQIFGEWSTVLAAYNCGEGRVLRVIRSQNGQLSRQFLGPLRTTSERNRPLRSQVSGHPSYRQKPRKIRPGFGPDRRPASHMRWRRSRRKPISKVSRRFSGIPEDQLKNLNPELRYSILPSENYALRVPPRKEGLTHRQSRRNSLLQPAAHGTGGPSTNTIGSEGGKPYPPSQGRYRSSIKAIAKANRLNKRYTIRTGQTLKIPTKYYTGSSASGISSRPRASYGNTAVHTVRAGDSLWVLARKYGTTTKTIQRLNGLSNSNLYIGQKLKISSSGSGTTSSDTRKYKVRSGDSPFSIARKHNMSLKRFLKLNRLTSRSKIYPGQVYYVE